MTPLADGAAFGSGTLVAVNRNCGLIVTNWHVVRDATGPILVTFPNGFRSDATVLRADRNWDLAALVIWRPNVEPVPLATAVPKPGEPLAIAGYGSGSYRTTAGECTQYVAPGQNQPFEMVELAAAARNGDSGGPILNGRGELAGVLFGSAAGRTTGSYCGRVRWFLEPVVSDFRRADALWLAQEVSRQGGRTVDDGVATVEARPTASATGAIRPSAVDRMAAAPPEAVRSVAPAPPRNPAVVVAIGDHRAMGQATDPPGVAGAGSPAGSNGATASVPGDPRLPVGGTAAATAASDSSGTTRFDQMKTVLAAIGGFALFFHALRLLGGLGAK